MRQLMEAFGERLSPASKVDASFARRRNALRLSLADVLALAVRHEGQHLQNEVGNEGAEQVFVAARIEQGHIEDEDVHAFLSRQYAPLLLDFLIVAPQPVYARDAELIARAQFFIRAR